MRVEPEPDKIRLPRAHEGGYSRRIVDDDVLDFVRVRQTVFGKFRVKAPVIIDLFLGPGAALHHVGELVGARSGDVAPILNVPELLDHLAGDREPMQSDEHGPQGVEIGLIILEYDRMIIGSSDRIEWEQADVRLHDILARLAAAEVKETLPAVGDIVRGQGSTVDWGLIVPFDSLADLEHEGQRIRGLPALRQLPGDDLDGQV